MKSLMNIKEGDLGINACPVLIILIVMADTLSQESPRIAKITSSAQQFKQLINSLRNRQNKTRHHSPSSPNQQEQPPNHNQSFEASATKLNNLLTPNNLFQITQEDQLALKTVAKTEIGGRDQLKKQKLPFDSKPESEVKVSQMETGVQFEENKKLQESKSKDISFYFQSPRKSVSIQCDPEPLAFATSAEPSFLMHASKNNQKAGQIVRQQLKNDSSVSPRHIRDIKENTLIEFCRKERLVEKSDPSEIFSFFTNLCLECGIIVPSPTIKKFKNCIYFGFTILRDLPYQGFLYFYDSRIYYGQFLNGLKHGLGTEIAIAEEIKFKGEFNDGRKTGKFYIQKPTEKYIGYLQNGLYHGEGRLTTPDYIYEGLFEQGEKNGYGQEFYPKTGVKISGMFKNGVLAKTRASRSIAELREKSKAREMQRLQAVRKKSLEKHSARMSKVRSYRQSEYQIDFQPLTDYNQLPRLHFNPSKLEVYRQPIRKLPRLAPESSHHHNQPPLTHSSRLAQTGNQSQLHKQSRVLGGRGGGNPQRLSSSENEEPLPTPYLSYPRRNQ